MESFLLHSPILVPVPKANELPVPGTYNPDQDMPFKFIVYGDSQANPEIHRKIAENILKINPALILHPGDLVSNQVGS